MPHWNFKYTSWREKKKTHTKKRLLSRAHSSICANCSKSCFYADLFILFPVIPKSLDLILKFGLNDSIKIFTVHGKEVAA